MAERIFDCDPKKRAQLLEERRFDLRDMAALFQDPARLEYIDDRFDYGEERRVTIGNSGFGTFTVVFTMRGSTTWLITAWHANRKERDRYAALR